MEHIESKEIIGVGYETPMPPPSCSCL